MKKDPLTLLADIERRCRERAFALPREEQHQETWSGIGFRIGDARLVTPVGEVLEILTYPRLTRVPATRSWVRGIANLRGKLLPVMDLREYLHDQHTPIGRENRVLVVQHKQVFAGLLVDEVLGLQHFFDEEQTNELPEVRDSIRPHLKYAFRRGEEHWAIFSMHSLAENPEFLTVAV